MILSEARELLEKRFWPKVSKTDGCWLWTGAKSFDGYGHIRNGRVVHAHRVSWELHNDQIPEGICVLHSCDVRHCVNPDHLFLGTRKDNAEDREKKGRGNQVSGERHGRAGAKLSEEQITAIREMPGTLRAVAARFGVHWQTVSNIKSRRHWRHL